MNVLKYQELLKLYEILHKNETVISTSSDEIEFRFKTDEDKEEVKLFFNSLSIDIYDLGIKSFSIKDKLNGLCFFQDINSLLDRLSLKINNELNYDLFVFDYDSGFLFYDHAAKSTSTNSKSVTSKFLIEHFIQYTKLLNVYLNNKGKLYEIERTLPSSDELVVVSKGEEKFITSIQYRKVEKAIFAEDYITLPFDVFEKKILSDEWLACYNNTLCQFMELQVDSRKTFANLYNSFTYIFNQTERNYQLYLSKFSFDKIRKQFKIEKNSYFENLNLAQDKISNQIIAIPISLGASILSFYQFKDDKLTLIIIYISILIYSLFIGYVVVLNLYDIRKVGKDVKEEKKNLRQYFPDLYSDFKSDFDYMRNKRNRINALAILIISALVITLILTTIFLMYYNVEEKTPFLLISEKL